LREIQQQFAATISITNYKVLLPAMLGTHSKVLVVAAILVILTVIP
jgi:hypothetical protein